MPQIVSFENSGEKSPIWAENFAKTMQILQNITTNQFMQKTMPPWFLGGFEKFVFISFFNIVVSFFLIGYNCNVFMSMP